jgi:CheY-like chemotaxis protein
MLRIDFARIRFLVADDHVFSRRLLTNMLASLGAEEIDVAGDGAEALAKLKARPADILFVDWVMPIVDGLELTRMVRRSRIDEIRFVPIIMVTAHTQLRRIVEARDAGITEFLRKPYSPRALYERVASVAGNPRSFVRTRGFFGPDRRRVEATRDGIAERRVNPDATVPEG